MKLKPSIIGLIRKLLRVALPQHMAVSLWLTDQPPHISNYPEAEPQGGIASRVFFGGRDGKPEAYRSVLRQRRNAAPEAQAGRARLSTIFGIFLLLSAFCLLPSALSSSPFAPGAVSANEEIRWPDAFARVFGKRTAPAKSVTATPLSAPEPFFFADTTTSEWTGATDTTWSTTTNWTPNTVPSTTVSAKFDTAFTNQPTSTNASVTSQGVWLATGVGQDVTITGNAANRILNVTGTATLSGQANAGIILADPANHNLTFTSMLPTLTNSTGFYVNNAATLNLINLNLAGNTLTLAGTNASGNTAITGVIGQASTAGSLIVNTAGKVTLSGANTFVGGLTLTSGIIRTSSSASVLGQGTLSLGGGDLQLAHASSTNLGRNTTVTSSSQITSDRSTSGAGFTYTLGTLSSGAQTLTIAAGSNVSSGTAGVIFGATTLTGNLIFNVGTNAALTLGAVGDGGSAFSFTKSGAGTLILSGTNTNTGSSTISAGVLQAGDGTTNGSFSGDVTNNANFTFNRSDSVSYGGTISGTGSVTQLGGGTLTLSGNNSYQGGTSVSAASDILVVGSNTALGTGALTINNTSTLQAGGGTRTLANAIVLGGNTTISGSNAFTFNGSFTSSGSNSRTLTVSNTGGAAFAGNGFLSESNTVARSLAIGGTSAVTISGVITNNNVGNTLASPLTYNGSNTLTLSNTNTYTGSTTVSGGGTISVASIGNSGSSGGVGAGTTINFGSTTSAGTLVYTGAGETTSKINNLSGSTGGATIDQSGTGLLKFTAANTATVAGSKTFTFQGSSAGTGEFGGAIVDGSGTTSVAKSGSGTWTLSGPNTYTGGATLNAGTLNINHLTALGTGTFVINGGTIGNTSGAAIGPFTNNNAQTWNGDFTFTGGGGTTHNLNFGTGAISLGTTAGTTRTITASAGTLTFGGIISNGTTANSLTKSGFGTLTLSNAETFTGTTTVSAGTLALTGSGSLASTTISIGSATFDVQGVSSPPYTLTNSQTLNGTNTGSNGGVIDGSLTMGGTSPITLSYLSPNVTLTVADGTLTLQSGETVTVTNNGAALAAGDYKLISKGTGGAVSGTPTTVIVNGTGGLAANTTASLVITSGELFLHVANNPPTLGTYTGTSISLSGNTTITPGAAPTNTTSINVSTSSNASIFKGSFTANTATGVVSVTDAHPAGTYTVTVRAFGGGGSTTTTFTLTVTNGTSCAGNSGFSNPADVAASTAPAGVAIGDFNGDGKQDMVVTNHGTNTVSIRLGDGLGGFTSPAVPEVTVGAAGSHDISVAVGDFNGDGKLDFVTANNGTNNVSIRLGDGTGGFTSPASPEIAAGGTEESIAVGDFNGDGKLDFVVANGGATSVSIRLGNGAGGFTSPAVPQVTVGGRPSSVAVGDFNGDGKLDFASANFDTNTISIRLGDGTGGFTSPAVPEVSVGSSVGGVSIGDFNGDGKLDFAAANNGTNTVSIRLGDGTGAFTSPAVPEVTVGTGPFGIAIGDFNGDGKQDFAVTNLSSTTVSIRLGDGAGGFTSPPTPQVAIGTSPSGVAIGDFNGDGQQDFVATFGTSSVAVRLGACTLEPTTQASAVNFTSVTGTSMTVSWTSGTGTNRIVLAHSGAAVNSPPVDGTSYTANAAFGSGTQIGTGNYVVYNGTGSSVNVTGLIPGTTYQFAVYEFNGSGGLENYLTTSPVTGIQATTPPAITTSTGGTLAFGSVTVGNTSAEQNYTVSGTNLTANIVVTAPTDFQVSLTTGTGFGSSVSIPFGSGTVTNVPVFVRYVPTSAGATGTLNITHTSGATTQNVTASGTGVAAVCTTPPSGMVAWYKGDGNANDQFGLYNGVLGGDAVATASGKVGQAFSFSGAGKVEVPDNASFDVQNLTIDAWVFPTAVDGGVDIIVNKELTSSSRQYEMGIRGSLAPVTTLPQGNLAVNLNGIVGQPNDGLGFTDGGGQVPLNTWTHVAMTFNGTVLSVYINGVQTRQLTGLSGAIPTTVGAFRIGARNPAALATEGFNGSIDEVEFFNRALTATEIAAIYNAGTAGKCTAPVTSVTPAGTAAFGNQTVGTTSTAQTITVANTGTANMTVTAITKTGTDPTQFVISGLPGTFPGTPITIAPSANTTFQVAFAPTVAGSKTANISITSDGGNATVPLTGTGIPDVVFNNGLSNNLAAGTYHDVTISNCSTFVHLTGNVVITGTLTINTCANLYTDNFTLSGAGAFVLASGGWLHITSANGITTSPTLSGNVQVTGTRTFGTTGNYDYDGSGNQSVGNGLPSSVNNLTIANTGGAGNQTVTGNSGQAVTGTLEIISGIYSSHSDYDNVLIDPGGELALTADITVSGNWTNNGTFTPAGHTVTFNGSGNAQTITTGGSGAGKLFAVLTINKSSGTAILAGSLGAPTLNLISGIFDTSAASSFSVACHDLVNITGGTFIANASAINVGGNWNNTGTFTAGTSSVTFVNDGNTQTISGTTAFNNLTIFHTGAGSVTAAGSTLSVTGLLRVQIGTFTSATAYNNVQIDSTGTLALSGPITVSGNWTNNGTFSPNGFTVNFNGAGAQTITTGGSGAGKQFNGLTVSNSSGGATVSGSLGMGSSNALGLTYASGTPTVSMTGGTFALAAGNPVTVTTTSALGSGDYILISAGSGGSVTGTAPTSLTMAGSGLAAGRVGSLQITGSQLVLHVACPTSFTVNDTGDGSDASPGDGVCETATGNGVCTLRAAIQEVNALSSCGTMTINFNISGAGVHTITPGSALPAITKPVIIDGYSQPLATANTLASGDNANILIELNGTSSGGDGLTITAGNSTIKGLVMNRFPGTAIVLNTTGGNTISGNFIGTDPAGTTWSTLGSGFLNGIRVSAASNTVGGTTPASRNIIVGGSTFATGDGIDLSTGASSNFVQGNYIGTDKNGSAKVGNTGIGVFLDGSSGSNNLIGGTTGTTPGGACTGACNLLSGSGEGLQSNGPGSNTTIQGNFVGTNASGTAAVPDQSDGVRFSFLSSGTGHLIGGTTASARNVISGNNGNGIQIQNGPTVTIQGNYVGVQTDGTSALGNGIPVGDDGIEVVNNATVGGTATGAGNIIANNKGIGVRVGGTGNSIRGNSIYNNLGLGIDLEPVGVTANDNKDPDTGPNNLQNFPVITSAVGGSFNVIRGTLNSTPGQTFTIDFYSNTSCNAGSPNDYGEGQTYLGAVTGVTTDGTTGDVSFTFSPGSLTPGQIITATATDASGNTSEFSQCFTVTTAVPGSLQFSAANYNDTELNAGTHTATITVTRTGGSDGPVAVHWATSAGTATAGTDYTEAFSDLSWSDLDGASKTFTVTVIGDTDYEANETVNLTLSAATNGAGIGATNPATLTIINDDAPPATLVVNTTADTDDGFCSPDPGGCTLREAINAANFAPDVSTISFAPAVTGTITLTSALPDLSTDMSINGPGASTLAVSGNSASRVFNVTGGTVAISGLTITGGNAGVSNGGGILNGATLTLTNSTVSGNTADGGGGIFNASGTLTLTNSTVSGNTATFGGGILNSGTLTLTNSTVSGNTAIGNGGGIFNLGGTLTLTNSTVSGNTANNNHGGGINNSFGTLSLTNCTVTGNAANGVAAEGGGIANAGGTGNVRNTIIAGNTATTWPDADGTFTSQGHNLIGDGTGSSGFTGTGDQVGASGTPINPHLDVLGNYGGPTQTHRLQSNSTAIDAGDDCVVDVAHCSDPSIALLTTDQRGAGFPRQLDGNGDSTATVDIGAYEAPTFTSPGAALDFDGSDDYVQRASSLAVGTTDFTMEAWINHNPAGYSGFSSIIAQDISGNGPSQFQMALSNEGVVNHNHLQFIFYNDAQDNFVAFFSTSEIPDNTWTHVAVVRSGLHHYIYINGVLDGAATSAAVIDNQSGSGNGPNAGKRFRIGSRGSDAGVQDPFHGQIDDVRLWSRALSCDEISQHKDCELTGTEASLVSYYKFDQGDAGLNNAGVTTAIDSAPAPQNGTLNNFALTGSSSNWITPGGVVTGTSCPAVVAPEIDVRGGVGPTSIPDGSSSPNATDGTEFGPVNTGSFLEHSFVITNTGTGDLHISNITAGGDFTIVTPSGFPQTVVPSANFPLTIRFTPSTTGLRTATVHIANDDCDEGDYDFAIQGTGIAPPTLTVNKVIVPGSDTGLFNLQIDGSTAGTGANQGNGGTTGAVAVSLGSHTVGETAGTSTTLADYTSAITGDCAPDGSVTLAAGENKVCTITNTRKPKLTVTKTVVGDTFGRFNLQINGTPYATDVGNNGSTGAQYGASGSNTFGETAGTATNLTDYTTVITGSGCTDNGNGTGSITLANGDDKSCTITNTKKPKLTVTKVLSPNSDAGRFDLQINSVTYATNVGDGGSTSAQFGTIGSNTFSETGGTSPATNLSDYTTTITGSGCIDNGNGTGMIFLLAGDDKTCTITNTRNAPTCATTLTVDSTLDDQDQTPGDGLCQTAGEQCTLRAAIEEANAETTCGPITIDATGVSGPIALGSALPDIDHDVTINGPVASTLTVQRSSPSDFRIFKINLGKTVTISGLTISGGSVFFDVGGGIYNRGTLTLTGSTVSGNTASFSIGGGIFNQGTLTLTNSTVSNNTADSGGGIDNQGAVTLTNSTISGNTAANSEAQGGGIYNTINKFVALRNCTVSNNTAVAGGGVFNDDNTVQRGTVYTINTIIAGNTGTTTGPDVFGIGFDSAGHNLIGKVDGSPSFPGPGDQVGTIASPIDPHLGPLQNNGGPTSTHALLFGSPALDAGYDCVADAAHCGIPDLPQLTTDQRGAGFPRLQGNHVDIGAFELQVFVVNTTLDHTPDVAGCEALSPGHDCTLREAINAANNSGGGAIKFAIPSAAGPDHDPGCDPSLVCTISPAYLLGSLPAITKPVFIDGYSQSGASPNTKHLNDTPVGDDAVLKIVLNGSLITSGGGRGLDLEPGSANSTIQGLVLNHWGEVSVYVQSSNNIISGNFIGTDAAGTAAAGSPGAPGIRIFAGIVVGNTIGGDLPALRNVISGNNDAGILLDASFATTVEGNFIGVNRNGTAALGNTIGVNLINQETGSFIGCEVLDGDNVISGNSQAGVAMSASADFNTLTGNFIGTAADGTTAIPNGIGVSITDASANQIGTAGFGNLISGNKGAGVLIAQTLPGFRINSVKGNFIGTNLDGTVALPNGTVGGGSGVKLDGDVGSTIGGSARGEGNVISGNNGEGVELTNGASKNLVQGNLIGVGADGVCVIGNTGNGIEIYFGGSSNNTIGVAPPPPSAEQGNRLAGKTQSATKAPLIPPSVAAANGNRAALSSAKTKQSGGSRIAEDPAPPPPLPTVGNTSAANIIANNGENGVRVTNDGDVGNLISQNSIYSNGGLGIDLGPVGVTPNDVGGGDSDTGANNLQNFPVITTADVGTTTVSGTLISNPGSSFAIEVFLNSGCDTPNGYGEGKTYLASAQPVEGAPGVYTWSATVPTITTGQVFTATATDITPYDADNDSNTPDVPHNDTSEFSACKTAGSATVPTADLGITKTAPAFVTEGNNIPYTITVHNYGPDTATLVSVSDTLPAGSTLVSLSSGCNFVAGTVTCTAATLTNGSDLVFTVVITPSVGAVNHDVVNAATVSSSVTDPNPSTDPGSNSASATTHVNAATCTPPPSGMVAWWPGDGNADDVKGGHNGTLVGGATFVPGKVDQAFSFDGSTGYVTVPDNPLLAPSTAITVDAWVKTNDAVGFHGLVSKFKHGGVNTDDSYNLSVLDGAMYWQVSTTSNMNGLTLIAGAIADGQWHFVAGTYDSTTGAQKLYIDGALATSGSSSGTINLGTGTALQLGASDVSGLIAGFLNGQVDEAEIFSSALLPTDIANIYNASSAGKCRSCTAPPSGMVSWWPGDGNPNDIRGSNNLTMQGGATFTSSGMVNSAFNFQNAPNASSGQYAGIASPTGLPLAGSPRTVDLWFKTATDFTISPDSALVQYGTPSGGETFGLVTSRNAPGKIYFYGNFADLWGTTTIQPNTWYHAAVTYNGTTVTLYLNGQVEASAARSLNTVLDNNGLTIALTPSGAGWNGQIDEVEIFNRALSQTEIQSIYDAGNAGKCHTSTLQFSSPTYSVSENGVNAVITATRTGTHDTAASVNYATVAGGSATGGASCGGTTDYVNTSGTLTFPANSAASQTFNVPICDDSVVEGPETVHLQLSPDLGGPGGTIGVQDSSVLTITDDDTDVSVAVSPTSVFEDGATNLVYTFTRNGVTTNSLTVNFAVSGTADSATDYALMSTTDPATFNAPNGTVTIGAGNTTATITIDPTADTNPEGDETVILTVTSGAGYNVAAPSSATGTITNDDPCPTTFTVNNNGDADDVTPGDGVCATGGAVCTLRAAIEEANALTSCGTIDINFSIGDSTIDVGSVLTISHNVNINGPSANKVAVSGTLATPTRVLRVTTGTVAMSNLTIRGARTVSSGSGLRVEGGNVIVSNTLFTDNVAVNGSGGAAGVVSGTLTIINSTISGNTATNGGGLYNGGATLNLINDTITSNSANGDVGGGACGVNGDGGGLDVSGASVRNTIIAGNTDCNGDVPNIAGSITNQGNNLLSGDPLLGALMNNGGPTFTHGLLYNSPAVDAGNDCVFDNTCVPALGVSLTLDQRGLLRKVDGDLVALAHVDIGAYERQQPESRPVPSGANAQVDLVDAKLTFTSVPIAPGDGQSSNLVTPNTPPLATASITVIDPGTQPAPPVGYSVGTIPTDPSCATNPSQAQCLPAFDVSTTAPYTPPVGLCFYLPAITDQNFFNGLKVLHREAGANAIYGDGDDVLVDPGSQKNFAAKIVCTQVSSFSSFVIAHTVTPTASNGTVSGTIVDSNGAPVEGAAIRMSGTQNRLTITDAAGRYHFDNVETNGFYTVVPSRANYSFSPAQRAFSQLGVHTDAAFNATSAVSAGNALNPLDTTEYFVRQQYLDFLGREPDEAGFNFWVNNIEGCGADQNCQALKRIDTSAAFFLSIEFQQTGYLVYRTYQAAYGDLPGAPVPIKLGEFKPDTAEIGNGVVVNQSGWETVLENNKQAYTAEFVQRARFTAAYPATMTPDQFVDQLFTNAGITPEAGARAAAISEFGSAPTSADAGARARALRLVAENSSLARQDFNQAFVLMQYFGYLRRDVNTGPDVDYSGFNFWLNKLNTFGGNFRDAEMVKAFLVSGEYRGRFPR